MALAGGRVATGSRASCSSRPMQPLALRRARPVARASSAAQSSAPATRSSSFHHGLTYTSLECNTFGVKFARTGVRVLVDPWLVGDLTFGGADWLIRGKKRMLSNGKGVDLKEIMDETDVIVLTQALDDHCHMPTLEALAKAGLVNIPIVGNPETLSKVKPLGFKDLRVLDHGQSIDVNGKLRITASVGALVGPPWSKRQLGVLFRELPETSSDTAPGASLFFEPHCDFDAGSVQRSLGGQPVDVMVSPVKSQLLGPAGTGAQYPLVMGDINLMQLLKILRPKVLVPLLNAEIDQTGVIAGYIEERGPSYDEIRAALRREGLPTRLEMPAPAGEALALAL